MALFDNLDPSFRAAGASFDDAFRVPGGGTTAGGDPFGTNATRGPGVVGVSYDEEVRNRLKAMRAGTPPVPAAAAPAVAAEAPSFLSKLGRLIRFSLGAPLQAAILAGAPTDAGAGSDVITDATSGQPLPRFGAKLTPEIVSRTGIPTTGAQLTPDQTNAVSFQVNEAADAKLKALQAQTAARTARVNQVIEESRAARGADAAAAPLPQLPQGPRNFGDAFRFLAELGRFKVAQQAVNEQTVDRRRKEDAASALAIARAKVDNKVIPIETATGKGAVFGDTYLRPDPVTGELKTSRVPAPQERLRPGLDPATVKREAQAEIKKNPSRKAEINAALKANGYDPI